MELGHEPDVTVGGVARDFLADELGVPGIENREILCLSSLCHETSNDPQHDQHLRIREVWHVSSTSLVPDGCLERRY